MPVEPGKIRNVAVVGHRSTGKTSLVEAMLFQAGAINRLGTIEAGSTTGDWDDDEHNRQMSLAASLCHVEWQGRKINLIDTPGDPGFQGDMIAALRVVEGALVVVSSVMGVEVQTSRAWQRAEDYDLSRVVVVNMLDRERADYFRTLEALRDQLSPRCVAVHLPIGAERDPGGDGEPGRRVPREAARLRGGDGRGADGALPRRPGALRRGGRPRAQGRGHARRDLPGRLRGRDEEPRDDRAARPARRGRSLAREEAHRPGYRRRRDGSVRVQDNCRSLRRPDQRAPRHLRRGEVGLDAREPPLAFEGARRPAPRAAGQGAHAGRIFRRR